MLFHMDSASRESKDQSFKEVCKGAGNISHRLEAINRDAEKQGAKVGLMYYLSCKIDLHDIICIASVCIFHSQS